MGKLKMNKPKFIKTYHPKSKLFFKETSIKRILKNGWIAQIKKNGFRLQVHVTETGIVSFSRTGLRQGPLPEDTQNELLENFPVGTVLECEHMRDANKIYIFDYIADSERVLNNLSYKDRFDSLPKINCSNVFILAYTSDFETAYRYYLDPTSEGIMLKSLTSKGFSSTSLVRCRKPEYAFTNDNGKLANQMRGKE